MPRAEYEAIVCDVDPVHGSLDHFMSLRVRGSEATGMVFSPLHPTQFSICVQHPASTNLDTVPHSFGDAVWQVTLKNNGLDKDFIKALKSSKK